MSDLVEDPDGRLYLPQPRVASDQFLKLVSQRRSSREFSSRELEPQLLADLLWAAFGVSNQDGYRTAPSARNWREIDVYVAMSRGLYRFDPHTMTLEFVRCRSSSGFGSTRVRRSCASEPDLCGRPCQNGGRLGQGT